MSIWYLENIDVNKIFCPTKMNMGQLHVEKPIKKGEYIYLPDQVSDRIYFLSEGRVKIGAYNEAGKEITKIILGKGEVFGELSLVGESKRRDFAQALENSLLCIVRTADMKSLMRDHNQLSLFLMNIMGSRVLEMEKRLESLIFKDSRTRVVEFLLDLVRTKGQRVGYEMMVRNFLTHQEIANFTATSRQTVTTILNELRQKNILTFNRKRLLVRDLDLLAREATP